MSQWAELRHQHFVEGVPKKTLARRFGLDVKTVRRALERQEPPRRARTRRSRLLDPHREAIESLLREDPKITAKRIGRLLEATAGPIRPRTLRKYVASLRSELLPREAFVHRTHRPGHTMEIDFGESWAVVGGQMRKVKFLVATLPASNAYFAKAYPVERLECLLDGIAEAFAFFGGVPERCVLDNTSLVVKKVLRGRDREVTEAFAGFRGQYLDIVFDQKAVTWTALHMRAFAYFGGVPHVIIPDNLKAAVIRTAFGHGTDISLHRGYRDLARHYGFRVDPTPPRSPQKKGKVDLQPRLG